MNRALRSQLFPLVLTLAAAPAMAQSGTLDQDSPATNAGFNFSASSLVWQQQVRVGVAGQLEGIRLFLTGNVGSHIDIRVRVGDGWNVGPVVFSTGYDNTTGGVEMPFIDMTSANLNFAVGDTFVWEVQGDDTGMGGQGSYVPPPGTPEYPEFLFLNGPGCYSDCGWRLAFQTYMNGGGGPGTAVCFGDGSGAPCGCSNEAAPGSGSGCLNSLGVGGVLSASGSADTTSDSLGLSVSGVRSQPGLFFQGNNTIAGGAGATFGDGLRCCGQSVVRLEIVNPSGPEPATADLTVTVTSQGPAGTVNPGDKKCYQYWYRDPGGSPCGSNFNFSNAVSVTWS